MYLTILELIFAILLMAAILIQQRGSGLGAAFGGGGNLYRLQKRGAEKVIFSATIVFAVIFFGLLVVDLFIA